MEQEKYHITVKNTKTGETLTDMESSAFICVATDGKETKVSSMFDCSPITALNVLHRTQKTIERVVSDHPLLGILLRELSEVEKKKEGKRLETIRPGMVRRTRNDAGKHSLF